MPGRIQAGAVVRPSLVLLQIREGAAWITRHSSQEAGGVVRIPVLRYWYWHGGRGPFFLGGSCRRGGGVSAARRNRGKGEQESSQEGTSVSYDHTQELFRFCRILRPWCRVLRRGPDPIDSIAVHCVFRHLHRLILLHMPLLINTTPVQPLDSTTDKEVKNTAFWPLPCPI